MFDNLKKFNLPELEEAVLVLWNKHKTFEQSLEAWKKAKPFRFFEGPPTANGRPGTHHVLARAFKDIVLRYKTMRGYFVLRRAGWDTHGLPVEIEIEKLLGLNKKADIEKYGIEKFNAQARTSVWKYKAEWEDLTRRVGFWLDFKNPYITYESPYIESLWWIFSEIHKRGYLKKLHKIVPWCPRCQTPLSNNELAQPGAYKKVKDPSLYVKFRLKNSFGKPIKNEYLLVWTTTPWTLPANMAIAVNPKLIYTKFKVGNEYVWSHTPPPNAGVEITVVEKIAAYKLVGREYEPLFQFGGKKPKRNKFLFHIIPGDFVGTEEGTGLVHISPAFGEEDFNLYKNFFDAQEERPEILMTVTESGKMISGLPGAGRFIKSADKDVVQYLEKKSLVYLATEAEHEYPFCWRCSTPLIYFARLTWFIEVSKAHKELQAANERINWIPEHIKTGRFGEWLKDARDWSISRERFWGTPLPIWEGEECDHTFVAQSFQDIDEHAFTKNTFFLVRHGEADHNVEKRLASSPETPKNASHLTEKGIAQVEKLGKELERKAIDIIITSPFARARETAKILSRRTGARVIVEKDLHEVLVGEFSHKKERELHAFYKNSNDLEERFSRAPENGETYADIMKRMMLVLKQINLRYKNKRIIIVSHGDPLWLLAAGLKQMPKTRIKEVAYPDFATSIETTFPNFPFNDEGNVDWHRPYVDSLLLKCPQCGKKMKRIKEVADAWFDSGAMPFAQWHYPFENKKLITTKQQFPADYIAEGIDQTRGWFYTLLAISVLLGYENPYKNVISMGLLLDKEGQKMSKSKGNVVDPWNIVKTHGADVLRWYFYTVNDPGEPKRFDEQELGAVFRRMFLIVYNSYVFLRTYADEKHTPIQALDQWILSRLHETTARVTKKLDEYHIGDAARELEIFVGDLSRWYIRRSRKNVSPKVLGSILEEVSKLLAPFTPFFSEALFQSLWKTSSGKNQKDFNSVHLALWPVADAKKIDKALLKAMEEVREIASQALSEREKAGIKVRQPLASLKIRNPKSRIRNNVDLIQLLKDEVNIKEIIFDAHIKTPILLDTNITRELYREGVLRELARGIQGARHDLGFKVQDEIEVMIETNTELQEIITLELDVFKKLIKAKNIVFGEVEKTNSQELQFQGKPIMIALRRVGKK